MPFVCLPTNLNVFSVLLLKIIKYIRLVNNFIDDTSKHESYYVLIKVAKVIISIISSVTQLSNTKTFFFGTQRNTYNH